MSALTAIMARLDSPEQPRSKPPPCRQFTPDAQQHQFTPHTLVGLTPVAPSSAFKPTVDPAIVFNSTRSTAGFDRDIYVRHCKMDQPRLLADLPFKRWKTDFIAYLRLKYRALIPQFGSAHRPRRARICACYARVRSQPSHTRATSHGFDLALAAGQGLSVVACTTASSRSTECPTDHAACPTVGPTAAPG
jgi:hypothetical protein